MKLSAAAFSFFLFAGPASAQYFSVGWSPGQKASSDKPPPKAFVPSQASSSPTAAPSSDSFMNTLLTSGPAVALLGILGVNVSATTNQKLWDERIPFITDDNYQDVIANEHLTPQEEKERAWVVLITGQAVKQDEISKLADNVLDTAYEQTQQAGDLPHIRWGRIDYLNVTRLTTKWAIWQVPYIVIITDRGQTLRFYRHNQVRWRAESLREFLNSKDYLLTPPWSSAYAPGGEREYILDYFANILAKVYNIAILFPRWLLLIGSGSIASLIIALMHRSSNKAANTPKPQPTPKSAAVTSDEKKKKKPSPVSVPVPVPAPTLPATTAVTQSNGIASSSTSTTKPTTADKSKPAGVGSPPKSGSKPLSPAATDSERESSAKPTKRSSTRPKKTKKT